VFSVVDSAGTVIEFIGFKKNSLHIKSKGKWLSKNRISKRIHHAGVYSVEKLTDNDPFYVGLLGLREIVRIPEDRTLSPGMLYLGIDDGVENFEIYTSQNPNATHLCLLVDDMQETIYTLKERRANEILRKPIIGRGKRWLSSIANSDNTTIEFTEAHCVK